MDWSLVLFLAAMVLVFWLLIIRPQQRRQKATADMQGSLSLGDEVMLTSGLFGTIADLTDDRVMLEVAPQVTVKVARAAIASVSRGQGPTGASDESDDEGEG